MRLLCWQWSGSLTVQMDAMIAVRGGKRMAGLEPEVEDKLAYLMVTDHTDGIPNFPMVW